MLESVIIIVILTYRRSRLLQHAIRSAQAQTCRHIRIAVFDNASGDETPEVVRRLAADDPRIEYHCHDTNIGLLGNYKAGFWYDNSRFTDFNTGESQRGNWGFYTLFDQVLVRFGEQGSNRGFGIAGSFLVSRDQSVSQMPYFCTAALVTRGIFPLRPVDVAGLPDRLALQPMVHVRR